MCLVEEGAEAPSLSPMFGPNPCDFGFRWSVLRVDVDHRMVDDGIATEVVFELSRFDVSAVPRHLDGVLETTGDVFDASVDIH